MQQFLCNTLILSKLNVDTSLKTVICISYFLLPLQNQSFTIKICFYKMFMCVSTCDSPFFACGILRAHCLITKPNNYKKCFHFYVNPRIYF